MPYWEITLWRRAFLTARIISGVYYSCLLFAACFLLRCLMLQLLTFILTEILCLKFDHWFHRYVKILTCDKFTSLIYSVNGNLHNKSKGFIYPSSPLSSLQNKYELLSGCVTCINNLFVDSFREKLLVEGS